MSGLEKPHHIEASLPHDEADTAAYEREIRKGVAETIPPEWLAIYEKENPEVRQMGEEPIKGFEERRRAQTREAIEVENRRREAEGKEPVTLAGIHAAPRGDSLSGQMLNRITESAQDVGLRRRIIEISNEAGKVDQEAIDRAVEQIREADGFVITTHTKRGMFNSFYTALIEALEEENLTGKLVGFAHTYDKPEEDSQVGPGMLAQKFFESKGCIIIPYSFMYANTQSKDEAWVEQDIAGNGVRLARGIERLTRSHLVNLLEDPEVLRQRKQNKEISPEWQRLQGRVQMVNAERKENEQSPLNVLFVLGGEAPAVIEKRDSETGEIKKSRGGAGARISNILAKNFEFLGLETHTIHLASQESGIESTAGNPNLTLAEVVEGKEESRSDAAMQEAYRQLLKADMVIFTNPVRWFNISWHLQKFIERMTPLEASGFLLEGKAFGSIVTFGEAGGSEVQAHLDHFALHNGLMAIPLGGIKYHLSMDVTQPRKAPILKTREMAARGTSLLVDYLAADGSKVSKMDFKGIRHPLEEIVDPGD